MNKSLFKVKTEEIFLGLSMIWEQNGPFKSVSDGECDGVAHLLCF